MIKYLLRLFLPQYFITLINKLFNREIKILGNYKSWK